MSVVNGEIQSDFPENERPKLNVNWDAVVEALDELDRMADERAALKTKKEQVKGD